MAGRGITLDILANVRDALQGTGDVEQALSDIESTLEDMARDGDKSVDKMSRGFRDLARDADRSADKIERNYKQAYRDVKRSADDLSTGGSKGFRKLGDAGEEVSGELRQNLGETFSSFRGDLEDLPQIAQDTLGGLAGSGALGGIAGLAATAAGAAGLGLIVASLEQQNEEAEKLKQRLSDAYTTAIEAGRDYIDEAQVIAELQSLMFDTDRAGEYNTLLEDQKRLGLDIEVLAGANIGRAEDLRDIQERVNTVLEDQSSYYTTQKDGIERLDLGVAQMRDRWQSVQTETQNQQDKVAELESAEKRLNESAREQINRTADAAQKRYEALAREPVKIKVEVDDSNVRNHRWPVIRIPGQVVVGNAGTGVRTWE